MEQKLSELMKRGAAQLEPYQHEYFDNERNPKCACAIGCAMYALGLIPNKITWVSLSDILPEYLWDVLWQDIDRSTLPQDVQDVWEAFTWETKLIKLIGRVNDSISRERAIEITEMLGY